MHRVDPEASEDTVDAGLAGDATVAAALAGVVDTRTLARVLRTSFRTGAVMDTARGRLVGVVRVGIALNTLMAPLTASFASSMLALTKVVSEVTRLWVTVSLVVWCADDGIRIGGVLL